MNGVASTPPEELNRAERNEPGFRILGMLCGGAGACMIAFSLAAGSMMALNLVLNPHTLVAVGILTVSACVNGAAIGYLWACPTGSTFLARVYSGVLFLATFLPVFYMAFVGFFPAALTAAVIAFSLIPPVMVAVFLQLWYHRLSASSAPSAGGVDGDGGAADCAKGGG